MLFIRFKQTNLGVSMSKKLLIAASLLLPLAAFAQKPITTCAKDDAEIAKLFDRWNASLATLDPQKVASNYADSAILLPTVDSDVHDLPAERITYFTMFLKKKPVGTITERHIRRFCNVAIDSGTYLFKLTGEDGKVSDVAARYTFVYQNTSKGWKIIEHHSSVFPQK